MNKLLKQTTAYKILSGDRRNKRLAHSYLLHFGDRKNLRAAAMLFALELFGAGSGSAIERRIISGNFGDVKIYPPEGKKPAVDMANEIIDDSALRPVEGEKKLYVFLNFDEASAIIQNKLLKTLEEPPEGVYFLLAACSLAPILDTVKSRVRTLEIPPFSKAEIYEALERKSPDSRNMQVAESCGGILGAAENMLEGGKFEEISEAARRICAVKDVSEIAALSIKYGDIKYRQELLAEMQRLYFTALEKREGAAKDLTRGALIYALESVDKANADVKFNAYFQSLLYDFMLRVVEENNKWLKLQA